MLGPAPWAAKKNRGKTIRLTIGAKALTASRAAG
jgi:hypothetical protein